MQCKNIGKDPPGKSLEKKSCREEVRRRGLAEERIKKKLCRAEFAEEVLGRETYRKALAEKIM